MVVGAVIGFAVKKVIKLVAILAGVHAAVLAYFEQQGVITVNWEAVQNMAVITAGDGGGMPPVAVNLISSLPVGGGLAVGAAVGFRKG
ncbi:FUN14 domain-containing protein [Halosimplex pelagicum]|uniref:FUN14 domain-containing protein n=1 Tax=Halosimplex pelagicum TaxID=869886 RepID=A0A7D5TH17_9EURY|nr:FUN14 domain-containing protein [Halosimplex pelagicum]QLH82376.1 hypothetical protein HZS54_12445 [Halosimplex pelagicum]